MELRHLRYFIATAEELNITRAAVRLRVSQPPLSRQIRDLEDEVGTALFDRTEKKLRLTPAGAYFLKEARAIVSNADRAAKVARATAIGEAGQIRIGFLSPLGGLFLPQIIRAFRRKYPLVEVDLIDMTPRKQLDALFDHEIDLAFVARVELAAAKEFEFETVMEVGLRLALPTEHRLAKMRKVPFSELRRESFITVTRSAAPATHDLFVAVCRSLGVEPQLAKHAERAQSILDLVAAGIGVAVLPEHFKRYQANVIWRPVVPALAKVPLCLAWRKNDGAEALHNLRRSIVQHLRRPV